MSYVWNNLHPESETDGLEDWYAKQCKAEEEKLRRWLYWGIAWCCTVAAVVVVIWMWP